MKRLSQPQQRLLDEIREHGYSRTPFTGGKGAGRAASAWYRTARSLADQGLVTIERSGDAQVARIAEGDDQ